MFEYTVETVRATAVGPLGSTLLALTDAEILALDDERAEALVVASTRRARSRPSPSRGGPDSRLSRLRRHGPGSPRLSG